MFPLTVFDPHSVIPAQAGIQTALGTIIDED